VYVEIELGEVETTIKFTGSLEHCDFHKNCVNFTLTNLNLMVTNETFVEKVLWNIFAYICIQNTERVMKTFN
jgi:hypothetical protein